MVIPILNNEYKVIFCWGDPKIVERTLKAWFYPMGAVSHINWEQKRGVCYDEKDCHPVIAMPRLPKTPEEIGTLAHEAAHAIGHIFDKVEEFNRDEMFAHSIGAVVREVMKRSKKK